MPAEIESEELDRQLEEPGHHENWDFEGAVIREGRALRGSTFSVRFRPGELAALRAHAEKRGVSTGEFVRRAALDAMNGEPVRAEDAFALIAKLAAAAHSAITIAPAAEEPGGSG